MLASPGQAWLLSKSLLSENLTPPGQGTGCDILVTLCQACWDSTHLAILAPFLIVAWKLSYSVTVHWCDLGLRCALPPSRKLDQPIHETN